MDVIELKYGSGSVEMEYDSAVFRVLRPDPPVEALDAGRMRRALNSSVESPPLSELARGKRSALIVVSDATRVARADLMVPLLLEQLRRGGIEREGVTIVIATGNHRPPTQEEIDYLLGRESAASLEVLQHDSRDESSLEDYGSTRQGTEVRLSRLLRRSDLVITLSMVNAHYFAGFTGGRKSIIPGLAGRDTIVANHLLAIDFRKGALAGGVEPGRLQGNPVHEDLEEGVAMAPPDFAVHVLLTADGEIGALFAGHWIAAHRMACAEFLGLHGVRIGERRPLVVASCGGDPKDIDLIQSHKTIQFACRALEPGGALVLLARCGDGFGNPDFSGFFPIRDVRGFLQRIREERPCNGQTALALHAKAEEFRITLISQLEPPAVRVMGMRPAGSLEEALHDLAGETGRDGSGFIIPDGATTLPFRGDLGAAIKLI